MHVPYAHMQMLACMHTSILLHMHVDIHNTHTHTHTHTRARARRTHANMPTNAALEDQLMAKKLFAMLTEEYKEEIRRMR